MQLHMENERAELLREQKLGEDWIGAIADRQLERLATFCNPQVTSRLLLPRGLVSLNSAAELVAEYRDWFGEYTGIEVEASRVATIGHRLSVFYRLLLRDQSESERIEQQLYFWLKDGTVRQLHLACSGFHPVEVNVEAAALDLPGAALPDPARDGLLEFNSDAPDTAATCSVLTPMINKRLRAMQTGQVLEVRVNDPHARQDVEAWSRLSGNPLLKVAVDEGQNLRFFVQKK